MYSLRTIAKEYRSHLTNRGQKQGLVLDFNIRKCLYTKTLKAAHHYRLKQLLKHLSTKNFTGLNEIYTTSTPT
jgi:hypothetical protein